MIAAADMILSPLLFDRSRYVCLDAHKEGTSPSVIDEAKLWKKQPEKKILIINLNNILVIAIY